VVSVSWRLIRLGRRLFTLVALSVLLSLGGLTPSPQEVQANRALPTDLSYNTETTWLLPGLPDLNATAGYIPHNFSHGEAIFQIGNEVIHGFRPGKVYPEMYVRDIAWGMETAQYYYPDEYLREPIEAYLRRQYTANSRSLDGDFGVAAGAGAIGGIITPAGRSNKQTITTDEETSLIHAAYLYYNMAYDTDWLQQPINGLPLIERLNLAADWLYAKRLDRGSQLLWRGHTTDWGDVKFEKGPGYTDYNPAQDHLTASIYDQALAYMALVELAKMNAAVGNTARTDQWQRQAEALKAQTNTRLWQPDRGFYLTHLHVTPLEHNFDESAMVSISNALAVYAGLTDFRQSQAIFQSLEAARLAVDAKKPGLSLYPYYPNQWPNLFFDYQGMGYGHYQNGGIWDWWGGVQIKAEFANGFAETGLTHLLQVANEWQKHPGNIIEWQSSNADARHEGSHYYSAAAGTMGSAIIEGFFGLELAGNGLTMQPRLGLNDGFIRVYQPATDRYAAYSYDWDQDVTRLDYGTNAQGVVMVKVLKLRSEQVRQVTIDGRAVEFESETGGHDTYTVFDAPGGQHRIELVKGQPAVQPAAVEVEAKPVTEAPRPSVAPNFIPSPTEPLPARPPAEAASSPEANFDSAQDTRSEPLALTGDPQPAEALTPARPAAAGRAAEIRLAFLKFASVALIILTSLALMVLAAIRRLNGLG
ncbi:MAG: trehalase family glycosidase, partial [Chloroflexota bacterium]